jgi:hypothetical protein
MTDGMRRRGQRHPISWKKLTKVIKLFILNVRALNRPRIFAGGLASVLEVVREPTLFGNFFFCLILISRFQVLANSERQ